MISLGDCGQAKATRTHWCSSRVETADSQIAYLFHFKHGAMAYSLDPNSFESVQLFVKHRADNTVKTADVEALGSLLYPAIAAFKSGQ